jgi:hypothetical protein
MAGCQALLGCISVMVRYHGRHQPTSVAAATASLAAALLIDPGAPLHTTTNPPG